MHSPTPVLPSLLYCFHLLLLLVIIMFFCSEKGRGEEKKEKREDEEWYKNKMSRRGRKRGRMITFRKFATQKESTFDVILVYLSLRQINLLKDPPLK